METNECLKNNGGCQKDKNILNKEKHNFKNNHDEITQRRKSEL